MSGRGDWLIIRLPLEGSSVEDDQVGNKDTYIELCTLEVMWPSE